MCKNVYKIQQTTKILVWIALEDYWWSKGYETSLTITNNL